MQSFNRQSAPDVTSTRVEVLAAMIVIQCPCPLCAEYRLIYDGMLAWRSGPRPPRSCARATIDYLPRADYEVEALYHCAACGAEFFEDTEDSRLHLYPEGGGGRYDYVPIAKEWRRRE